MEQERFFRFTRLVDSLHKSVMRLRLDNAPAFGVKGVHVFWMYELSRHPDGLSAAELAQSSKIDRSLVSRELSVLKKQGLVEADDTTRSYNAKLRLTALGRRAAEEIKGIALQIQTRASEGIPESELAVFYTVLEKLSRNLSTISEEKPI